MIREDVLERGLAAAADDYVVPDGALDRLRDRLMPATAPVHRWRQPTTRGWVGAAAAAVVLLMVVAVALGGGGGDGAGAPTAAGGTNGSVATIEHPGVGSGATAGGSGAVAGGTAQKSLAGSAPGAATGAGTAGNHFTSEQLTTAPAQRQDALPAVPAPAPDTTTRVVKTGVVDLQVPKGRVGATLGRVTAIATVEQGFVADSRSSEGALDPSGQVTLRIPVATFDNAVGRVRAFGHEPGSKVLDLETSGKDVTGTFVDLKARIRALEATRRQFITLLSKATTIGQTLSVQDRITQVQTQLEQLQGQLKSLKNRAAYSTLTVTVDQRVIAPPAHKTQQKSGLHRAFDRSVSRFTRGIDAIVGAIGTILLVVLVVAVLWAVTWLGYRGVRRRLV